MSYPLLPESWLATISWRVLEYWEKHTVVSEGAYSDGTVESPTETSPLVSLHN